MDTKDFQVEHWLSKLMYIHNGFNKLIQLVGSPIFSHIASATVQIECVPLTPPAPPKGRFTVTSDAIAKLLTIRVGDGEMRDIRKFLRDIKTGVFMFISEQCSLLNVRVQISLTPRR